MQLTVNVPIDIKLKYVDVWPNDTSKNQGKGFGPNLSLTGDVNGQTVRVYPKGFLDKNIGKLIAAGVVADGNYSFDPAEKYSIPVKSGNLRIANSQSAGEKYAHFDILAVNGAASTGTLPQGHVNPPGVADSDLPEGLRAPVTNGQPCPSSTPAVPSHLTRYKELTAFVLAEIEPMYRKADIGLDPSAAAACVATLFIQESRNGR